jgi:hypothetical protein
LLPHADGTGADEWNSIGHRGLAAYLIGQRVGKNGGQTLDFPLWNTEKPLGKLTYPTPEGRAG